MKTEDLAKGDLMNINDHEDNFQVKKRKAFRELVNYGSIWGQFYINKSGIRPKPEKSHTQHNLGLM